MMVHDKPSRYTAFITPGEFDLHSIDTFGMNAKPNSINPIGYFGTGLKYAIAVLLRNGAKITLYCNGDKYTFFLKDQDFRGSTFRKVWYRKENTFLKFFAEKELPYTTELGKNWELWQAFRELYANTLDESGEVFNYDPDTEPRLHSGEYNKNETGILIDHFDFALLVAKKDEIFLNPHRELLVDADEGNVASQPANHVYYRGMRAMDLPEEQKAIFTWNIIEPLELTEDRTIKSSYAAKQEIRDLVVKSEDKDFIKAVLTAPDKSFEKSLDFEYAHSASPIFKDTLKELHKHERLNRSAGAYYSNYLAPPPSPKKSIDDKLWIRVVNALNKATAHNLEVLGDFPEREQVELSYLTAFKEEFDRGS